MPRPNVNPEETVTVRNASDPEQVNDAKRKERDDERLLIDGLLQTVNTRQGRHFLWRLLSRGSIFMTSWQENPAAMAYREGERNIALWVLALWMKHDPDSYMLAMTEHRAE